MTYEIVNPLKVHRWIALLLLIFSFSPTAVYAGDKNCAEPVQRIERGIVDLRCWNQDLPLTLKGEWRLDYRDHLSDRLYHGKAPVPGIWRLMDTQPPLSHLAIGLYSITLRQSDLASDLTFALKIPRINSARHVALVDAEGHSHVLFDSLYRFDSDATGARMQTPLLALPRFKGDARLIVEVNNTYGRSGGLHDAPILGSLITMNRVEQSNLIAATSISTLLLVFAIINMAFWFARGRDLALMMLTLMSLALAARNAATSNALYILLPELSINVDTHIGWLTFLIGAITGSYYFHAIYPRLVKRWMLWAPMLLSAFGLVLLWTTPLIVLQFYGDFYRSVLIANTLIIMAALVIGMLKTKEAGLKTTVLGGTLITLAFAIDLGHYQMAENDKIISATSIAWLFFMATQTLLMSRRYSQSIKTTEILAKKLTTLNTSLEAKVVERTSELEEKNRLLDNLTKTDPLTQVGNRRALEETAQIELNRIDRSGQQLVVALLDLDNFKQINDQYGHSVGDDVLCKMAKILKQNLRSIDFVARWGGEEFCLLLPSTSRSVALQTAERLRIQLAAQIFSVGEKNFSISASFGLTSTTYKRPLEELIHEADQALYKAKDTGRNKIAQYWELEI